MPLFAKKPVVIEAHKFIKSNAKYVCTWANGHLTSEGCLINTLEGVMLARFGDWVVKGVREEFYPVDPEIFEETYAPVADAL